MLRIALLGSALIASGAVHAQSSNTVARVMPANTLLTVTPMTEVSSKKIKLGDMVAFTTIGDVTEQGNTVIPRGSTVKGEITFKTGKAIGGKSGKFEISFRTVQVRGVTYALSGVHRQEGKGNTVAAVFASILVSGRSAVMIPGQEARAFTAVPIPFGPDTAPVSPQLSAPVPAPAAPASPISTLGNQPATTTK
jgi:hypothetical protein